MSILRPTPQKRREKIAGYLVGAVAVPPVGMYLGWPPGMYWTATALALAFAYGQYQKLQRQLEERRAVAEVHERMRGDR